MLNLSRMPSLKEAPEMFCKLEKQKNNVKYFIFRVKLEAMYSKFSSFYCKFIVFF